MMLFGAMAVVGSGKIEASTVAALGFLHESVGYCLFSLEFSFVAFISKHFYPMCVCDFEFNLDFTEMGKKAFDFEGFGCICIC
ncbi:hypothetical protein Hanom_Chr06g00538941 [Helianthus anomalus]